MTTDSQEAMGAPGASGTVADRDDEISLWEVLAVLLRRRGTIIATTVVIILLAVAYTLLRAPTYTTQTSFSPQGAEASSSQLMALATQFGVSVPGAGNEEVSPAFYQELLASREILHRVASVDYEVQGETGTRLPDLLEVAEDEEVYDIRLEKTVEALRENIVSIEVGRETGVVTVEVTTKWPDLSQEIARRLLDEVSRFNLLTRQTQAAAEREFIEQRVDSAKTALTEAEDAMQAFLQANRRYEDSPELIFQQERLQRDIMLRQQVYTSLVQSFEEARISEVRDTPVITVLQAPFLPPGPDERRLLLAIALGMVLGGMSGIVLAFVVEAVRRPTSGDPAREDFQQTWDSFLRSLPFVGARRA